MTLWKRKELTIEGEIERIGSIPGYGETTYAFRLVNDSTTYRLLGESMTMEDREEFGIAIALTVPGDLVRFQCDESRPTIVFGFENLTYMP